MAKNPFTTLLPIEMVLAMYKRYKEHLEHHPQPLPEPTPETIWPQATIVDSERFATNQQAERSRTIVQDYLRNHPTGGLEYPSKLEPTGHRRRSGRA